MTTTLDKVCDIFLFLNTPYTLNATFYFTWQIRKKLTCRVREWIVVS